MNNSDLLVADYRSSPELTAYYADRRLMWRNVILIGISNLGWGLAFTVTVPLITLKLLELGLRENIQATIGSFNGWALSFLVMWFSWMSDHTCTRMGRRKPYLFMAAPFIIIPMVIFPFFAEAKWLWFLVALQIVKMIAMDLKASTFPLLSIDCVPRALLARTNSIFTIAGGIMGFLAMRYAGDLIKVAEWFPYVLGGVVMTLTTLAAFFIKEPPIHHPATERFKPWSTFKVAAHDKRIFWLMLGVAMISGFMSMNGMWVWFWAKETLHLERQEIFSALSWASLVNIALAYPIGWLIDRWGGFRVVLIYWVGQVVCFAWAMNVHDKTGLIILSLATTVIAPLYTAADIMIYKSADPKDVGSMTASNSCIRNAYGATLGFVAGWVIFFFGHNFRIGFVIGIVMSTVGLLMFIIHRRLMRRSIAALVLGVCSVTVSAQTAAVPGLNEIRVDRLDTGCFVRKIVSEKMVYRPGEEASANCELVNVEDKEWQGTVVYEMVSEVDRIQELGRLVVTIPAAGTLPTNYKFNVGTQTFGHELRAILVKDGIGAHTNTAIFTVAENFWDVALGSLSRGIIHSSGRYGEKTPQVIEADIARMRLRYSNWFEKSFWAPDDWGNLTPDEPEWLSGQGYRWENAKWLKLHIAEAHKQGIKAISYGKGIAGGPSAYHLLRRNPEFFMRDKLTGRWGINADLWDLENWNHVDLHIFKKGTINEKYASVWHRFFPDLSKREALDHGVQELIDSSRIFGFDGVRFDGHFSAVDDVVSTYNMRRMKETVWAKDPDYLFGFNLCSVHDYPEPFPHEVNEGLAGGALWMNEAIGQWTYDGSKRYTSWRHYARTEHLAAQRVQAAGGTYHYIYSLGTIDSEVRKYYKFVIGILNAAHPCYGDHEFAPGCQNWGKFLTRWGGVFWHPGQKDLDPEKRGIHVEKLPEGVDSRLWARSIPLSAERELLVIPFLRFPGTDGIEETDNYPAPVTGARVKLDRPDLEARLKQAWWLAPDQDIQKLSMAKDTWTTLPGIAPFGMLILELNGCPDYRPVARPRFTAAVSAEEVKKSLSSGASKVVVDPLRPELNVISDDKIHTTESEAHSWSMRRLVFDDSEASGGKAAGADKTLGKCCTGGYLNDFSPGRYRISARMKLTQPVSGGVQMTVYENVVQPGPTWKDREGSRVQKSLKSSQLTNEYREIEITDNYAHYGIGFCTVFIHFGVTAEAPAATRFMVDWVRAERLEDYTDQSIAAKAGNEKTVVDSVGPRDHVLWIRGMFDDLYRIDQTVEAALPGAKVDKLYQRNMPKAEALSKYGTLIMPNVPVDKMTYKERKAYSDWTKAGGHLVILGGDYSLGQGMMRNTFFDEVLPCRLIRNDDVVKLPENSALNEETSFWGGVFAKNKGRNRIFYAHVTEAKTDAEIDAKAGDLPLLMSRKVGKGRCTVFAGTVLGGDTNDPDMFWNGPLWAHLFARMLKK